MEIDISKFNKEELKFIGKKCRGMDLKRLESYNDYNYLIYKIFDETSMFIGFIVSLQNYHGIDSKDICIEEIVYFGDPDMEYQIMGSILNNCFHPNGLPFDNVYFNPSHLSEEYVKVLSALCFVPKDKNPDVFKKQISPMIYDEIMNDSGLSK